MDPAVGNDQLAGLLDCSVDVGTDRGIAHGGDLLRFIQRAAEGGHEEGEGGIGGGEVAREAVDEDALEEVSGEQEGLALAEELGGGQLEVGDRGGRRRGEGDEKDLTEDDVFDLGGRALGFGSRHWRRTTRR